MSTTNKQTDQKADDLKPGVKTDDQKAAEANAPKEKPFEGKPPSGDDAFDFPMSRPAEKAAADRRAQAAEGIFGKPFPSGAIAEELAKPTLKTQSEEDYVASGGVKGTDSDIPPAGVAPTESKVETKKSDDKASEKK